jgi:hypothetical protein
VRQTLLQYRYQQVLCVEGTKKKLLHGSLGSGRHGSQQRKRVEAYTASAGHVTAGQSKVLDHSGVFFVYSLIP